MECKYCGGTCVKDGTQNNGRQRYKCKSCHRKQQALYSYNAYQKGINDEIVTLTKEGVGIRSTARILDISPTTLLSRIIQITYTISQPAVITQRTYEADEIKSLVRGVVLNKWIPVDCQYMNALTITSCSDLGILYFAASFLQPETVCLPSANIASPWGDSSLQYSVKLKTRSKSNELSFSELLNSNPVPIRL